MLLSPLRAVCLVVSLGVLVTSCGAKDRQFVDVSGGGGSSGSGGDGGTGNVGVDPNGVAGSGEEPLGGAPVGGSTSAGEGGMAGSEQQTGGSGGEGGYIPPPEPGVPGFTVPAGGILMKSTNFTLLSTTGEAPGGQQTLSSTNYKLTAGLVGATQTQ